ncbi:MAG: choice-of-anchor D domain-containing protein, partial [Acidobacteriota bacterium]|nr:choice-of-anchor D domain-containing protein [Acidobacteriota bacterium]
AVPAFVRVRPQGGTLAPGSAAELIVTLDGSGLTAGVHHGTLEIETNDPLLPTASVLVSLAVIDAPRLTLRGDPVVLESTLSFDAPGAVTRHRFPTPDPATGDGSLEVVVLGDFGTGENATITAEGIVVGTVGELGSACASTGAVHPLPASMLDGLLEDGVVEIDVRNAPDVGAQCSDNTHTVRLVYPGGFDPLAFGETFTVSSRERHVVVANDGSLPLELTIESNAPEFAVSPLDLSVAPGHDAAVSVVFAPVSAGAVSSTLEIHANDPRALITEIALEGAGLDPPVLRVAPEKLGVAVPAGTHGAAAVTIANDGGSPLDFEIAVDAPPGTPGVTVEPGAGSVAPQGTLAVEVGIDARNIQPGAHERSIAIRSNDPARPEVVVPLSVDVTERPVISVSPARLDFGSPFAGTSRRLSIEISNHGSVALAVSSIASDLAEVVPALAEILVPAGDTVEVGVTYTPAAVQTVEGRLTILSDDPELPVMIVETRGSALPPPRAGVEPGSIEVALPPRSTRTRSVSLELANRGESPLGWSRPRGDSTAGDRVAGWVPRAKGDDSDAGAGAIAGQRLGGADAFDYRFRDSDETGGPAFAWFDISEIGTPLAITEDDQNSGVVFLGFEFPFYGRRFESVNVCTNGWLSFTNARTSFSNSDALPDTGYAVPENLVAPFWDDLDPRGVERIFVHGDGARFIVQFTAMDRFSSAAELTFQVELRADGIILFRYLTMSGALDSATIGVQNGEKSRGLLVSYNEVYVHDALAIELVPPWISAGPDAGVVSPGGTTEIELALTSEFLDEGDHETRWTISTDDPENETLSVPVVLHVREITLDRAALTPRTIQVSSGLRWIRAALQLPAEYDPGDVVVSSVSVGGVLFARPDWKQIRDTDGDGVDELIVKFDAGEFLERFPARGLTTVTITGEVENRTWFTGTATVRIPRP